MLTTKQELLAHEEIAVLREWLKSKGAKLFRKCVTARIHENQIEATRKFADERVRMDEDGRQLLNESKKYRETLKVLDEFADIQTKPYAVRIEAET